MTNNKLKEYDYEKENSKECLVCHIKIDYHVDGLITYEDKSIWIHRDHSVKETEKALGRKLSDTEKSWIKH